MVCTLQTMIIRLLVCLAGVTLSVQKDNEEVESSMEKHCFAIGNCMPTVEPTGSAVEICQVYGEAVTCMQIASDACRKANFPPDFTASAEVKIKELRQMLHAHCSDVVSDTSHSSDRENESDGGHNEKVVVDQHGHNASSGYFSSFLLVVTSCLLSSAALFYRSAIL